MDSIHWHSVFFLAFALVACGFALAVVLARNIVRMAFCLVMSLSAVAGLFFLAGADFLGAMQLMVYVGGTLVLLAFGVMLTARGPFVSMWIGWRQWLVAASIGLSLLFVLLQTVVSVKEWNVGLVQDRPVEAEKGTAPFCAEHPEGHSGKWGLFPSSPEIQPTTTELGMGLIGVRIDAPRLDSPAAGGPTVMPGYLLVFEIISIHLLVVLVGAAYMARPRRRARPPGDAREAQATILPPITDH